MSTTVYLISIASTTVCIFHKTNKKQQQKNEQIKKTNNQVFQP